MTRVHLFTSMLVLGAGVIPAMAQTRARGPVARGQAVFARCAGCHSVDTADRKGGPSLKGLFRKAKFESSGKAVTEGSVMKIVNDGQGGMPAYKASLKGSDRSDLLAYLKSL